MFCPECGEVIATGPLDLRACHGAGCTLDRPEHGALRLWRAIGRMFGRPITDNDRRKPAVDRAGHSDQNDPIRAE